jgi:ABC-type uncharacterized transport system ATPase subunit
MADEVPGKKTLVSILYGLLRPDSGRILVNGQFPTSNVREYGR